MVSRQALRAAWKPLFWIALAAVLALSLLPPSVPTPSTGWDKSNHLLAFAALAVLGRLAYPGPAWPRLAGLLAFGGLIEILQSFTAYRSADWHDLVADAAGLLIGWALSRLPFLRALLRA